MRKCYSIDFVTVRLKLIELITIRDNIQELIRQVMKRVFVSMGTIHHGPVGSDSSLPA